MSLPYIIDGETDADSTVVNAWIDAINTQVAIDAGTRLDAAEAITARTSTIVLDAREWGVTGDGTTDSTTYLQNAIDDAQDYVSGNTGAPLVMLPYGTVILTDEINKRSAGLVGASTANNGCRVVWNGAAGGTAFTQSFDPGGTSFGLIANLSLRSGTAEPGCWILFNNPVDVFYQLEYVHFLGGATQIKVAGGWTNCHWRNLRFDGWQEYAIELTSIQAGTFASFDLDQFTGDNGGASKANKGFLHIANEADCSNMGTVSLRHARFETNGSLESPNAFVVYSMDAGDSASRSVGLHLQDITLASGASYALGSIFHRSTSNTTGSESFIFDNVRCNNVTAYLGGTWPTTFPTSLGTPGNISYMRSQNTGLTLQLTDSRYMRTSTDAILDSQIYNDTNKRLSVDASGKHTWGGGSSAGDTTLYRGGADLLKTDDKFVATAGIGVGNSASGSSLGSVTNKIEVFDGSGNSLGYLPVYDAIT